MDSAFSVYKMIDLLVFAPVIIGLLADYQILQNNYRYSVVKGYFFLVVLPIIFVGLGYVIIKDVGAVFSHATLLTVGSTLVAYLISAFFLSHRIRDLSIKPGSEKWFMNRFYCDMLYAALLSIPAILIRFYITNRL